MIRGMATLLGFQLAGRTHSSTWAPAGIGPDLRHGRAAGLAAPVAMGIAEQIGGAPSLAAVFAVVTGMIGAAFGPWLLTKCRVQSSLERGLAMGTTSHGQGTARILQENEEAGAFAGLGMGLTALGMAVLLPLFTRLALSTH